MFSILLKYIKKTVVLQRRGIQNKPAWNSLVVVEKNVFDVVVFQSFYFESVLPD